MADEKQPSILVTIPERLEPLGYATAQFAKNQLGDLGIGMSASAPAAHDQPTTRDRHRRDGDAVTRVQR